MRAKDIKTPRDLSVELRRRADSALESSRSLTTEGGHNLVVGRVRGLKEAADLIDKVRLS